MAKKRGGKHDSSTSNRFFPPFYMDFGVKKTFTKNKPLLRTISCYTDEQAREEEEGEEGRRREATPAERSTKRHRSSCPDNIQGEGSDALGQPVYLQLPCFPSATNSKNSHPPTGARHTNTSTIQSMLEIQFLRKIRHTSRSSSKGLTSRLRSLHDPSSHCKKSLPPSDEKPLTWKEKV